MKVALVGPASGKAGIPRYTQELFYALQRYGEKYNITPFLLQAERPFSYFQPKVINHHADIYHFTTFTLGPFAYITKKAHVLTVHDLGYKVRNILNVPKYFQLIAARFIKSFKYIITPSTFVKKDLIHTLHVDPSKIFVIPHGISEHFKPLKIKRDDHLLLHVSGGSGNKNINIILKAFKLVLQNDPSFKLVIVGLSPSNLRKIKHNIECNYKKISHNIILQGKITDEKLVEYYNKAKLFIFPSLFEGFGLPPLEAMKCGTPVIVSNIPPLKENIKEFGIVLSKPTDEKELASKILDMTTNANLWKKYHQLALKRARDFNWEKIIKKYVEIYNRIT